MKRIFGLAIAIALLSLPAVAQRSFIGGECINPSGNWIPIASSGGGQTFSTPQMYGVLGQFNGAWQGLQCDASGNLIVSGGITCTGTAPNQTCTVGTLAATAVLPATVPVANAIFYGADPTNNQSTDASVPINAAGAATAYGVKRTVYLPAGVYHIKNPIFVALDQCLIGDPNGTFIDVSVDFSPTATGGEIQTATTSNTTDNSPCFENIIVQHHQPPDFVTTTTQATSATGTTITVASASGIVQGDYVYDNTTPASIPNQGSNLAAGLTTVSLITGNVITLSNAVIGAGVGNGDSIHFAQPRANFTTLAQGCSLTAGAPGCKYLWAFYNNGAQEVHYNHILVTGAWDCMFQRGQAYFMDDVKCGALDVGLDQDASFNFSQMGYMFWSYGLGFPSTNINGGNPAFGQIYYDGSTTCANFGENDGLSALSVQCWVGKVNILSNATFTHFTSLMMDGNNADISFGGSAGGWTQIGDFYSTKGLGTDSNPAITVTSGPVFVSNLILTTGNITPATAGISVSGGSFRSYGSKLTTSSSGLQLAKISAGTLELDNAEFKTNGSCGTITNGFIQQTGGSLIVNGQFDDACSGPVAINSSSDSAANRIGPLYRNGWTFTPPGIAGIYTPIFSGGVTSFNNPSSFGSTSIFNGIATFTKNTVLTGFTDAVLATVGTPTSSGATAGGAITVSATNTIYVDAIDSAGNHSLPALQSANVATTSGNQTIPWTWTATTGAISYRIWCTTSGTPAFFFTSSTNSYTQAGDCSTGTALTFPTTNTTGNALIGTAGQVNSFLFSFAAAPGLWIAANTSSPATGTLSLGYSSSSGTFLNSPSGLKAQLRVNNGNASEAFWDGTNFCAACNVSTTPTWNFTVGANAYGVDSNGIGHEVVGAAIASASSITPVSEITHITGTTPIATILASSLACTASGTGCQITLIPDGLWTTTTAGNIALAITAVVGQPVYLTYDSGTSKWYPSYAANLSVAPVSNPVTSATGGSGTGTVACATASCTNLRGSYTVAGGTFATGTLLTLVWPTTTAAYVCNGTVLNNATGASIGYHSVATATGMTFSSLTAATGLSIDIDYACQP